MTHQQNNKKAEEHFSLFLLKLSVHLMNGAGEIVQIHFIIIRARVFSPTKNMQKLVKFCYFQI